MPYRVKHSSFFDYCKIKAEKFYNIGPWSNKLVCSWLVWIYTLAYSLR